MKRLAMCLALALVAGPAGAQQNSRSREPNLDVGQQYGTQFNKSANGESQSANANPSQSANAESQSANQGSNSVATRADQQVRQSQQVLWQVSQAENAINAGDDAKADGLLKQAGTTLRTLAAEVPGRSVLQKLDRISQGLQSGNANPQASSIEGTGHASTSRVSNASARPDFAPLMADVSRQAVFLDPRVIAGVQSAQQASQAGNSQGSMRNLQLARERLVADVALLPIEDAYARVVAARSDLQAGDRDSVLSLLNGIPVMVTQVQVGAPLVPARFDLRAAAAAANAGQWNRAAQLAGDAAAHLQSAEQVSPAHLSPQLTNLADRATQLRDAIASGARPNPTAFRQIANETQSLSQQSAG